VTAALVALGAAIGAPARYYTDRYVQSRRASVFPWGTFLVNFLGSFVLGVLVGAEATPGAMALVGTGFCGAFTTYSTFSYETHRLLEARSIALAAGNVVGSLALTLAAAIVGYIVGGWIA
jgi:CrcB protein